jgi:hypothetical protein
MDSFKYDQDKGLSMFVPDQQKEVPVETFEKDEDEKDIEGDKAEG